ncbi:MAG: Ig-like domain-containing protein [Desulfobulbaceae bacterium]|nr:Ig-like domain-containing protein [Desulfobulbaceae bacterium]
MNCKNMEKQLKSAFLVLFAVTLAAGPSAAVTYDVCASDGTVTMPDGAVVPVWSYVDTGGGPCGPGLATLSGLQLEAAAGETLTVNLSNALSVPVSVFIPGMAKTAGDPLQPQTVADGQGRERLTSLDRTVAPGGSGSYSWTAKEGTYLYHSGTDIRTQVPMGMYGAVVVSGSAYPAVAGEEVLIYSEIDPALNADPAGFGGARVSTWNPRYFLINGASYPEAADLTVDVSSDVLLRFVNAGLDTFAPTLGGGLYMDVIAEDGNLYPYPLRQYGIELPPGKTVDTVINIGTADTYPLYDRSLHLANGGMIVAIQAGAAAGAPIAVDDPGIPGAYTIAEEGSLIATAGGTPAGVLDNDTGGAIEAVLVTGPAAGTLVGGLAVNGSFTYTPNPDFNGSDIFTYTANDGAGGPNSNTATVTITVTPVNDPPAAVDDSAATSIDTAVNINVVSNDMDADGNLDPASVTVTTPAANGSAVPDGDGTVTYVPNSGYSGSDSFAYQVCDTGDDGLGTNALCDTAAVTVEVSGTAVNQPPTANADTVEVPRGSTTSFNIVGNDVDPDGHSIDPTSVIITTGEITQRGGTVVNNFDGTVTYTTPNPGWRGTDTFQYTVEDDPNGIPGDHDGLASSPATVSINVVR